MSKLDVLIAGSTGYIGVQLVSLLIKHRYMGYGTRNRLIELMKYARNLT